MDVRNSTFFKDPVSEVSLRLATKEDIQEVEGGFLWKVLSTPWYYTTKVLGTIQLLYKGANTLEWDRTFPQKLVDKVRHKCGLNPEEVFMTTMNNFILGNSHRIGGSTNVMKAILDPHRNEEFFKNSLSMNKFLSILQTIFPEEKLTENDFMMTCSPEFTTTYRNLLISLLKGRNLKTFIPKIYPEVEKTLKDWEDRCEEGESINVNEETHLFTSKMICQLIFADQSYAKEVSESIDFMNVFILKSIMKKTTEEDKKKFLNATKIFRETVENVLNNKDVPLFDKKCELTNAQKKSLIFLIFFAGEETTASALTWQLLQLARSPELQEKLYKELHEANRSLLSEQEVKITESVKKFFARSFGEHPPAYGVARSVKNDICMTYRLEGEEKFRKKILHKGEIVSAYFWDRAKQELNKNDDDFNEQNFIPFGWGKHRCPGEDLARKEILLFIAGIVMNYTLDTEQKEEIPKIGAVTLKLQEDVKITIKPRHKKDN